jgi:hypothetical protein
MLRTKTIAIANTKSTNALSIIAGILILAVATLASAQTTPPSSGGSGGDGSSSGDTFVLPPGFGGSNEIQIRKEGVELNGRTRNRLEEIDTYTHNKNGVVTNYTVVYPPEGSANFSGTIRQGAIGGQNFYLGDPKINVNEYADGLDIYFRIPAIYTGDTLFDFVAPSQVGTNNGGGLLDGADYSTYFDIDESGRWVYNDETDDSVYVYDGGFRFNTHSYVKNYTAESAYIGLEDYTFYMNGTQYAGFQVTGSAFFKKTELVEELVIGDISSGLDIYPNPVPEPATLGLFSIGALFLARRRHRS